MTGELAAAVDAARARGAARVAAHLSGASPHPRYSLLCITPRRGGVPPVRSFEVYPRRSWTGERGVGLFFPTLDEAVAYAEAVVPLLGPGARIVNYAEVADLARGAE